ncbi:serine protease [Coprinopsis marcescibilis]|uniref:Serine protease n=1 Tax=Coprinopsis marcescibilis TaxID=230819 RepID=A0A5C3KNX6_COPMA|nr:serine protease [Coprinopsis marcescibilis]
MQISCTVISAALVALLPLVVAKPTPIHLHMVEKYSGEKTDRVVVTLKPGISKASVLGNLRLRNFDDTITHQWDGILNGFAGRLDSASLEQLRASPDVESISEDGIFSITALVTQKNANWGLSRLSSVNKVNNLGVGATTYEYIYEDAAGRGTDIYVLGLELFWIFWYTIKHRLSYRYWNQDYPCTPITRSLSSIGSAANVIGVKVLDDTGSGTLADIVATLSFAGGATTALDNAVISLINSGVHVVTAAGNANATAQNYSPARVARAITVGAVDITDTKTTTSNWGAVIDVYAPGQNIVSAWATSDTATKIVSGTSMAAPYVAGLIAYFISFANNTNPADMGLRVKEWSLVGMVQGLPQGTPNNLVTNSYVCGLGDVGAMICI